MYSPRSILVTGGCGFIGSHVVNRLQREFPHVPVVNLDCMSYCASHDNVRAGEKYTFVRGSVCSLDLVQLVLSTHKIDTVLHFAAESHVDASFGNSLLFTQNNVVGTHTLLEAMRTYGGVRRFVHVSTDEVYGETNGSVVEIAPTAPTNPYAASKAAAEAYVCAYRQSYGLPAIVTRSNNIYGPQQYPEKVIPKFILRLLRGQPCCLHGSGQSVRHFLYVDDVVEAFVRILRCGDVGETYNIGGDVGVTMEWLANTLIGIVGKGSVENVADRAFNDQRYEISSGKIKGLGWAPEVDLREGLRRTYAWYSEHGMANWRHAESALDPHPNNKTY